MMLCISALMVVDTGSDLVDGCGGVICSDGGNYGWRIRSTLCRTGVEGE